MQPKLASSLTLTSGFAAYFHECGQSPCGTEKLKHRNCIIVLSEPTVLLLKLQEAVVDRFKPRYDSSTTKDEFDLIVNELRALSLLDMGFQYEAWYHEAQKFAKMSEPGYRKRCFNAKERQSVARAIPFNRDFSTSFNGRGPTHDASRQALYPIRQMQICEQLQRCTRGKGKGEPKSNKAKAKHLVRACKGK